MKNYIYILFLIFFNLPDTTAQKTFSKVLRKGYRAAAFYNAFMVKDTIMATGTVLDSTWGAWFVKMDTTGKVLLEKQYKMNPIPEFYVSNNSRGFIQTSDGGFAMIGETYLSNQGVFIKIKNNGDLDFITYHIVDHSKIDPVEILDILETQNHYLLLLRSHFIGSFPSVWYTTSILRLDKKGKILNEFFFEAGESFGNFTKIGNNNILMNGGGILDNGDIAPKVAFIDSLGTIKSRKWGTIDSVKGMNKLRKSKNGWVYIGRHNFPIPTADQGSSDYYIVGTDEDFQMVWKKRVGYRSRYSVANNVCPIGNDEYLALFTMNPRTAIFPTFNYNGAFIQKFNGKGDLFWSRMDTMFWEVSGNQCKNEYVSALPLPSGNIIVLGWSQKCYGSDEELGAYAWIVKLSKDGCLLEPACGISTTGENFDIQEFRAFPNPASSVFTVEWKIPNESTWRLYLRDYSGRVVQQSEVAAGSLRYTFPIENLASGIYFYELRDSNGKHIESGKMMVQQ